VRSGALRPLCELTKHPRRSVPPAPPVPCTLSAIPSSCRASIIAATCANCLHVGPRAFHEAIRKLMICQMFIALRGEGGRSERGGADLLGKRQAGDLTRRRFKAYELNAAALNSHIPRSIGGRRRGRAFIQSRSSPKSASFTNNLAAPLSIIQSSALKNIATDARSLARVFAPSFRLTLLSTLEFRSRYATRSSRSINQFAAKRKIRALRG